MNKLELQKFMKNYGLTSNDIAEMTRVSLRTVKSWEYGERNISKSALKILQDYSSNPASYDQSANFVNDISVEYKKASRVSFTDLSIDEKLNMIYEDSIIREEKLNNRIEVLEEQLRLTQMINRTYLKSLAAKAKIKKEEIKQAESEENIIDTHQIRN